MNQDAESVAAGLLCKIFGHRAERTGWWGDSLYGKVRRGPTDGCRVIHFEVWNDCKRCGKQHITARFHDADIRAHLQEKDNG